MDIEVVIENISVLSNATAAKLAQFVDQLGSFTVQELSEQSSEPRGTHEDTI